MEIAVIAADIKVMIMKLLKPLILWGVVAADIRYQINETEAVIATNSKP